MGTLRGVEQLATQQSRLSMLIMYRIISYCYFVNPDQDYLRTFSYYPGLC